MLDVTPHPVIDHGQRGLAAAYDRSQVSCGSRPVWCVVESLPKAERRAHASLHRFGFEAYLPLITTRWRDRTWHTHALFPRYLFVKIRLDQPWSPVKHAPGVFMLVSFDGTSPAICPAGAVEALQAAEASRRIPTPPEQLWGPGAACRLDYGPCRGLDAVVLSVRHDIALVALLMFGHLREVAVSVDCLRGRDE